jgi:hypothetical protein
MGKNRVTQEKDNRIIVARRKPKNITVRSSGYDIQLRVRRLRTNPANKREEFLDRLDAAATKIQDILDNDHSSKATKIKAANSIANIIRASYAIVRDIDIEEIEREIEEIKAKAQEEQTQIDFSPLEDKKEGSHYTATGSP